MCSSDLAYYYHLVELAENEELAGLSAPMRLGASYERAELPDAALEYFRLADRQSENASRAGERRAIALLRTVDRPADALAAAERLAAKDRNDVDSARLLALAQLDAGRLDDARKTLDIALKTAGPTTALLELDFRLTLTTPNADAAPVLARMKSSGMFSADALASADGLRKYRTGDIEGARSALKGTDALSPAARSLLYYYLQAQLDGGPAARAAFIKAGGSRRELGGQLGNSDDNR